MSLQSGSALLRIAAILLLAMGVWALSRYGQGRPIPQPADAAAESFSAARALQVLNRILGPELPRPVGSAENANTRARIVDELNGLGIPNELQSRQYCSGARRAGGIRCAVVVNIIGHVIAGEGPAVVLVAHYDSVAAGPGAGDDASGVATILESIRALKASGVNSMHPLMVLFTDGEEAGLLGSRAFLQAPGWRERVGVVVNVESRGSQGPSLLFQTSPGDRALVSLYADHSSYYATSSLFPLIYRILPNDTDLSPFLDDNIPGLNFAFIEGVERYHTALDRLEFIDPQSLQQHGENVLGVAQGLLQADFAELQGGEDNIDIALLGRVLPSLPASWALPLSLGTLLATFLAMMLRDDARADRTAWYRALAIVPLLVVGAVLSGLLFHTLASLISGSANPSYAYPLAMRLSLSAGMGLVVLTVARLWNPSVSAGTIWIWPAFFGVITAIFLPGLSPYFIFPALIATPILLAIPFVSAHSARGILLWATLPLPLFIWLGLAAQGESIMGLMLHPLFTVSAAFALAGCIPLLGVQNLSGHSWFASLAGFLGIALGASIMSGLLPSYSAEAPQRLNISYAEDYTQGRAIWSVDALTLDLRDVADFSTSAQPLFSFGNARGYVVEAGAPHLAPPQVVVDEVRHIEDGRTIDLRVLGGDDLGSLSVIVPAEVGLKSVSVGGQDTAAQITGGEDFQITCVGQDCSGKPMSLTVSSGNPFEVSIVEQRRGLPLAGVRLVTARGALGVPSQGGDVTVIVARAQLP